MDAVGLVPLHPGGLLEVGVELHLVSGGFCDGAGD